MHDKDAGHLKVPTYLILIFVILYVYTSAIAVYATSDIAKVSLLGDPDVPKAKAGCHTPEGKILHRITSMGRDINMTNMVKMRPKLYVLDNGRMSMDKNWIIAMHNPATLNHPNATTQFVEFPIYTVLIDHPEGKILFDTACNPNSMGIEGRWAQSTQLSSPWTASEECYLHNRLEQLHIGPADIKYVVASHLHLDHAGCLELFTNATIIVHEDEFNGALQCYARNEKEGAYVWADIDAWIKNQLQWRTIKPGEDNLDLVEGIKILNFGSGHAWGMLGLQIEMPEAGGIILASDAIYTAESFGPPVKPPGIIYDTIGYRNSVEKIRTLAARTNSQVWFGHDADQFRTLRKSTEGYYE